MPTISDYLSYAQVALASYGQDLLRGTGLNEDAYRFAGMAQSQAITFDRSWSVLDQADIGDGFSAVLFQRVDANGGVSGEKVLGIRGTDGSYNGIDFGVDLINIAMLGSTAGMPQWQSLEAFYQRLVSSGKLGAGEQLTVTGHSLGGFLAQAFAAKHDTVVRAAYAYNAPGLSGGGSLTNIGTQLLELQADESMAQADREAGKETFIDKWIADRAAMLEWLVLRNEGNLPDPLTVGPTGRPITTSLNFEDKGSGTRIRVGTALEAQRVQIVFGGDAAEAIDGFGQADHLYDGAGNEVLKGQVPSWVEFELLASDAASEEGFSCLA